MRKIGIIASGCTELGASVILAEGEEKLVKAEDLVVIARALWRTSSMKLVGVHQTMSRNCVNISKTECLQK